MIQGKVWGFTQKIEANPFFEFHRIEINAGSYCSKHLHKHKWNGFWVESGELEIHGEYHMFKCNQDTVCFELYWAQFDHNDIERETVGGAE